MARVIEIWDLSLAFERDGQKSIVLDRLSLDVHRGEFLAIVDPSSIGRPTLLRVLTGLARPNAASNLRTPIVMVLSQTRSIGTFQRHFRSWWRR